MDIKQVIVVRRKFTNSKGDNIGMRKGKEIAQSCHAAMSFLTRNLAKKGKSHTINLTPEQIAWCEGNFKKVCVQVQTEEDLLEVYRNAKKAGLEVHLIKDSGLTEFGEPTHTCLAIGPHEASKIDPVTGHLQLY